MTVSPIWNIILFSFSLGGLFRQPILVSPDGVHKELKKKGFVLSDLRDDNVDDAMDEVFSIVLTKEDIARLDELPNNEAIKVWGAILDLTYGNRVQEKN